MIEAIGTESPVFLDANVIIESHRTNTWRALAGGHFRLETVEDCVIETQTGNELRREFQPIDYQQLIDSLREVHCVSDTQKAELAYRIQGIALDEGESSLWAHALSRDDSWLFCGPDKASIRCGINLGFRDRIVSLEELLHHIGCQPKTHLRTHYTKKWLNEVISNFILDDL